MSEHVLYSGRIAAAKKACNWVPKGLTDTRVPTDRRAINHSSLNILVMGASCSVRESFMLRRPTTYPEIRDLQAIKRQGRTRFVWQSPGIIVMNVVKDVSKHSRLSLESITICTAYVVTGRKRNGKPKRSGRL